MAEKQDFLVSSSITGGSFLSTQKAYFWPKNGVQPSRDNTHDALYLHVPTELPHRPLQLLIHDQTWQEMVDKHVFFNICLHNLPSHTKMCLIGQQTMSSLMMPPTLTLSLSYPTGHNSHSLVTKNCKKLFKNMGFFTSAITRSNFINTCANKWCTVLPRHPPMCPPPPHSYSTGYYSHPFVTKSGKNR